MHTAANASRLLVEMNSGLRHTSNGMEMSLLRDSVCSAVLVHHGIVGGRSGLQVQASDVLAGPECSIEL